MSLENKIEDLTNAINLLRETILMDVRGELSPNEPHPDVTPDFTPEPTPEVCTVEFDEFKNKCLDFAKAPNVGREKVKEVLKEFGATKASDVSERDRAAVLAKLESL